MPDRPLPNDPRFGFFDERPDQRLSDDENHAPRLVYPTRDNDFEMREIERLMAQLDAARRELQEVYASVPVFMQARLDRLRAMLGEGE